MAQYKFTMVFSALTILLFAAGFAPAGKEMHPKFSLIHSLWAVRTPPTADALVGVSTNRLKFDAGFVLTGKLQHKAQVSNIDTLSFAPNTAGGWTILSYYLHQDTPDSVQFELILEQTGSRIQGSQEKLVGTIANPLFLPQKDQKIDYSLLPGNTWYLLIKKSGDCYLAQVKGSGIEKSNLPGNPDVIPIKVRYKNN